MTDSVQDDDSDEEQVPSGLDAVDDGDGTLVRMWGDVDASLRNQASAVMAKALQHDGQVVVDASGVEFIDSTGLAFILQLLRAADEDGRRVVLRDPPALILEMFDLLGIGGQVPLEFSPR
ncbi:MAG: STAS domain-containing protein [Cellulomonadaceae bacterium]|nr:STAS domain-containing protein [Cellulomonadaceae bacterium]